MSHPLKLLLSIVLTMSLGDSLAETLQYQVTYQGVFSAGAQLPIADVSLQTQAPGDDAAYLETELGVSSQEYAHVEAFYPIRYRFRSWYLADRSACLASEYYEQNRRKGERHRLIHLDDPQEPFVTQDLVADGDSDLARLRDGSYRVPDGLPDQGARFDRLGLLQRVRALELSPGMTVDARVSNGRAMLDYRVTVESRETIDLLGRSWLALKLRFEGFKTDERGRQRHAHRPVFFWFSDDVRRIPLRALSRHALGRFTIELRELPGVTRLVQAD